MNASQAIIDPATQKEIIHSLAGKLRANYVFPDVAEQICARLHRHLADGDYAEPIDGEFFAFALTHHLQEVNGDEHLWVRWHPEPLPDKEGQLRHNEEWMAQRRLKAELGNFGLHSVERLPGNVGLLDIRFFERPAWGGDTAVAAMQFLAHTHALIIDLRKCTGGVPGMVALISSYLFDDEPVHLNSIYWRDDDVTQQYWTLSHVPGKRFAGKPAYVLISEITFSGGEEFAYNLQARQRAILIGEKTDGGAHPGGSHRVHPHFEVFIPIGRAINPVTGSNWESSGVTPDIPVAAEQALEVAYRLALESVIERLGEPPPGPLGALLAEVQTALNDLE